MHEVIKTLLVLKYRSDPDRHGDDQTECKYNENSGYVVYSAMGSFYLPTLVILYTYASIIYVVQTRNREFAKVVYLPPTNIRHNFLKLFASMLSKSPSVLGRRQS